jgi:hypothetical protein
MQRHQPSSALSTSAPMMQGRCRPHPRMRRRRRTLHSHRLSQPASTARQTPRRPRCRRARQVTPQAAPPIRQRRCHQASLRPRPPPHTPSPTEPQLRHRFYPHPPSTPSDRPRSPRDASHRRLPRWTRPHLARCGRQHQKRRSNHPAPDKPRQPPRQVTLIPPDRPHPQTKQHRRRVTTAKPLRPRS